MVHIVCCSTLRTFLDTARIQATVQREISDRCLKMIFGFYQLARMQWTVSTRDHCEEYRVAKAMEARINKCLLLGADRQQTDRTQGSAHVMHYPHKPNNQRSLLSPLLQNAVGDSHL